MSLIESIIEKRKFGKEEVDEAKFSDLTAKETKRLNDVQVKMKAVDTLLKKAKSRLSELKYGTVESLVNAAKNELEFITGFLNEMSDEKIKREKRK